MPNPKALRYPQNYDGKGKFLPPVMRAEAAVLCPEWIDKEAARGAERLPRGQSRSRLPAMKAMRPPNRINNAAEKPISPPPIAAETGVKLALRSPVFCLIGAAAHRDGRCRTKLLWTHYLRLVVSIQDECVLIRATEPHGPRMLECPERASLHRAN
jgi:hypothetical protein